MNDVFYEESANPTNLKLQKVLYIIYTVLMWISIGASVFILYVMLFVGFDLTIILSVGSAILFGIIKTKFYYCVDLTYVNGSTRIIKVQNYKKRKKLIMFESNEVVQVGKITSESFEKVSAIANIKVIYATPNKDLTEGFYVQVLQNGQQHLVILECKETYLQYLVAKTGKQVVEKDYK